MGLSDCCWAAGCTAVWAGSGAACCGAATAGAGLGAAGCGVLDAVGVAAGGGVGAEGVAAGALEELLGVSAGLAPGRVMPGPAFGSAAAADLGMMSRLRSIFTG